jgi:hypothetical protein
MAITVKAVIKGYYAHRRIKEGQHFVIKNEKEFSKEWMQKVDAKAAKKQEPEKPVVLNTLVDDEGSTGDQTVI